MEEIVLGNIREMAQKIVLDEMSIREEFICQNVELADKTSLAIQKDLQAKRKRTEELSRLIQLAYEDRLKGKMPEDVCKKMPCSCKVWSNAKLYKNNIIYC